MNSKKKNSFLNLMFLAVSAALLFFLFRAPPETTAPLPLDDRHAPFQKMGKKEAEKHCDSCHGENKVAPLSSEHPPKYRCLFCHKRQ
ncbi:MAG: hypothetical protein CSA32_05645 [Desulfobulbus propionicus]|nr:MAG: hypothetical protein CSA32_05645 [Desulfobulbus propionicus]